MLSRSRAVARTLNLQMKLSEIEVQADGKKELSFIPLMTAWIFVN